MPVGINKFQPARSPLDAIANALNVVNQVYGIKANSAALDKAKLEQEDYQAKKDKLARMQDAGSKESAAARAAASALSLPVAETDSAESINTKFGPLNEYNKAKFEAGLKQEAVKPISQLEHAKLIGDGFREVAPGTKGSILISHLDASNKPVQVSLIPPKPKKDKEDQPKTVPAGEAASFGGANAAIQALDDVNGLVSANEKDFGPGAGLLSGLQAKAGIGDSGKRTRLIDAELKTRAQIIGKYLEGGKLTDSDIERYKAQLPQFTDAPDVARGKVQNLQRLIAQKQSAEANAIGQAGYDTSGLVGSAIKATPSIKATSAKGGGAIKDAQAASFGLKIGSVEDGHMYVGGNPADPNSWKKVK